MVASCVFICYPCFFILNLGEHVELAKKYQALIIAVEHRFYGASINKDGLEMEQLQFLSSQQALADLAAFHMYISEKLLLTRDHIWISFGGSYPGNLAAWFRLKVILQEQVIIK